MISKIRARQSVRNEQGYNSYSGSEGVRRSARQQGGPQNVGRSNAPEKNFFAREKRILHFFPALLRALPLRPSAPLGSQWALQNRCGPDRARGQSTFGRSRRDAPSGSPRSKIGCALLARHPCPALAPQFFAARSQPPRGRECKRPARAAARASTPSQPRSPQARTRSPHMLTGLLHAPLVLLRSVHSSTRTLTRWRPFGAPRAAATTLAAEHIRARAHRPRVPNTSPIIPDSPRPALAPPSRLLPPAL